MSEKKVGQLLGLPDQITPHIIDKNTEYNEGVLGYSWDITWAYGYSKILSNEYLEGLLRFKKQRVSNFKVLYRKRDGSWTAYEAPPTGWLKLRQKEIRNGEPWL